MAGTKATADVRRGVGRAVLSGLVTAALLRALERVLPKRRNVEGREVPTACGLAPLLGWAVTGAKGEGLPALMAAAGGLLDDLRPRETGGIGRRLRALLEGRFDTALVKALLVVLSGAGRALSRRRGAIAALDAVLISSFAHTVNLLDTAPGRAVKWLSFWGAVALGLSGRKAANSGLLPLLSAIWAYAPYDLRGRCIMGDAGAYGLGVALGARLCDVPLAVKPMMAALFLSLAAYAEVGSISRAIEGRPLLRFLDRLGRRRRC